jgi:general secretion pathway protein G
MRQTKRNNKAFTIVELLVVIMIITMLAAFVAPRMFKGLGKARKDIAKAKMAILESRIVEFATACERYPDESSGLEELVVMPEDLEGKWNGPYLKQSELLDPWGNPYIYREEGQVNPASFDLISFGADGVEGGEGDNADIYND